MDQATIHRRRWHILGVLVISLLVVVIDNTILNVALKVIADPVDGLGASQGELEWAVNSYTLVFAGLLFTWGVLGDRIGRKRVLMLGMALFGLASLASAYAGSPGQLIAMRALMGLGGAAVLPSTLSIITNVFEPHERGRAIGIWAGAVGLAIAIGPITGGALLERFWWGSVFLVNVPIVALGLVLIASVVPESRDPNPRRTDPLGVVLSIAGLALLVYGIIRGGQLGAWTSAQVLGTVLAGLAILVAFVAHERASDHPTLDVVLFRNPRFSAAVGAIGLTFFALMGVTFFMVFYLQSVRGYTPLQTGLWMLPVAVAQVVFSPRSAAMVQRYGAKAVCTTGLLLIFVSFLAFQLLDRDSPMWLFEVILFVQGVGMANVMPPATESVMSTLPRERAGSGSAINNTVRQVGGALGVAVLGSILSSTYRDAITPHLAALPALPAAARHVAGESIEATLALAERLGAPGAALVGPAEDAFVHAMHVTALGSALFTLLGALVVFVWLPGKPATGRHAKREEREADREEVGVAPR